jgi:hypothetical protein
MRSDRRGFLGRLAALIAAPIAALRAKAQPGVEKITYTYPDVGPDLGPPASLTWKVSRSPGDDDVIAIDLVTVDPTDHLAPRVVRHYFMHQPRSRR